MIFFKNLMDSLVFEKCFGLKLRQTPFGNLYLGKLWEVLPPYISCIGRKSPCKEIANVLVIERLSELPSMVTEVSPLGVRVSLPTGTYFNGAWLMFKMSSGGMLRFSTLVTISYKNKNSISLRVYLGCLLLKMSFFSSQNSSWQINFRPSERNWHQYHLLHKGTYWLEPWQLRLRQIILPF